MPDYLSYVSGGGFTGASCLDWKYRHNQQDSPEWHQKTCENVAVLSVPGSIDAIMFVFLCVVAVIILPAFTTLAFALPTAYSVDYIFGDILRAGFQCPNSSARANATESESCKFVQSQDETFTLFVVLLACCAGFYLLKFIFHPCHFSVRNKVKLFYSFLCKRAGCLLLMTFRSVFASAYFSLCQWVSFTR